VATVDVQTVWVTEADDALIAFGSSECGLTPDEAERRLRSVGPNASRRLRGWRLSRERCLALFEPRHPQRESHLVVVRNVLSSINRR
jgi:hypothetical protein